MGKVDANKRVCAMLFDIMVINLLCVGIMLISDKNLITFLITTLLAFLFYSFRDSFRGKSIGKYVVGLKVVDRRNKQITVVRSFKRNIPFSWVFIFLIVFLLFQIAGGLSKDTVVIAQMMIMPVVFVVLIIEYIIATGSEKGLRIGDKIAKTHVTDIAPNRPAWLFSILGFFLFIIIVLTILTGFVR